MTELVSPLMVLILPVIAQMDFSATNVKSILVRTSHVKIVEAVFLRVIQILLATVNLGFMAKLASLKTVTVFEVPLNYYGYHNSLFVILLI